MLRLLPIIIVIAFSSFYFYLPLKRQVLYSLRLANDPTVSCCEVSEILSNNGQFDESAKQATFNNEPVDYPKTSLAQSYANSLSSDPYQQAVLGTQNSAGAEKWIEVSLKEQRLRAWEGNQIVMEFPVSSGRWAPTPTGDFSIWYKTRSQTMKGGSKELGTYYYLPNVPHNMFFYKGYAIHGAYWHNNFGRPMSHGCVNSPLPNVAQLFEWTGPTVAPNQNIARASVANPGTRVFVH